MDRYSIGLGLFIVVAVGGCGYFIYYSLWQWNILNRISQDLRSRKKAGKWVVSDNGYFYAYHSFNLIPRWVSPLVRYSNSNSAQSIFCVEVPCRSIGKFVIDEEGDADKIAKKIGVASEIQTGDPSFDNDYYIRTDTLNFTSNFFADPLNRAAIRKLFDMGSAGIVYTGKGFKIQVMINSVEPLLLSERIRQMAQILLDLSKRLPQAYPADDQKTAFVAPLVRVVFTSVTIIFCSAIIIFGSVLLLSDEYVPVDKWEVFLCSLKYSLPIFVIYFLFVLHLLKKELTSHRNFIEIIVFSFLALLYGGYITETIINITKDKAMPTVRMVLVLDKYVDMRHDRGHYGISTPHYHLITQSWRSNHKTEDVEFMDGDSFDYVKPAQTKIQVVTKPGFLAHEWYVSGHERIHIWKEEKR
jgi:hypothetical protein